MWTKRFQPPGFYAWSRKYQVDRIRIWNASIKRVLYLSIRNECMHETHVYQPSAEIQIGTLHLIIARLTPTFTYPLASSDMANVNRLRALALYKELHRLGRDYPDPTWVNSNLSWLKSAWAYHYSYDFHGKLRRLFESEWTGALVGLACLTLVAENRQLTNTEDIEKALRLGEYIKNGEFP